MRVCANETETRQGWRRGAASFLTTAAMTLLAAGCGDDVHFLTAATPTAQPGTPTAATPAATATPSAEPTATARPLGARPVEALPPGPLPQETTCGVDDDRCDHARTSVFAVAHAFTDPDDAVLYRVTVDAAATGTDWGDGTNGFFYQAVVNGDRTFAYVPFNGMGVGDDGKPMLPQFTFIVEADVAEAGGEQLTILEIDLCATDYNGGSTTLCSKRLWTDTYRGLPVPSIGLGPADAPLALNPPEVLFDAETGTSAAVPNNGVYPAVLEICPTLDRSTCAEICADPESCDEQKQLTSEQVQWFYDHLLFFDLDAKPYTNDIFDDALTSHRSMGVLTLDEAAYALTSTEYRTRYGDTASITARDLPAKQLFFYSKNGGSAAITVGVEYLYDDEECNGHLNEVGCGSAGAGGVSFSRAATITPDGGLASNVVAEPANSNFVAGIASTRSIDFATRVQSKCTEAVNPLAINPAAAPADMGDLRPNRPNYVISNARTPSSSWNKIFPPALYYVLPSGFGNCQNNQLPFCELSSGYAAYVPHYLRDSGGGTLNGGSTDQSFVDGFVLADQYAIQALAAANENTLVYFDNCGYGSTYQECGGTASCDHPLGSRPALPSPPNNGSTYTYSITNSRPGPVVLGKECCASWYQKNDQTNALEPPVQIVDGYGVFIGAGATFIYGTVFSDEVLSIYDAVTGNRQHKQRLNLGGGAVYHCNDANSSVTVGGSGTSFTVDLRPTAVGNRPCLPIGPCPFGMTASADGPFRVCRTTKSSFALAVDEWAEENLADRDLVVLTAWGAAGGTGGRQPGDGDGGAGGFARSIRTKDDFADLGVLYSYVGNTGTNGTSPPDGDPKGGAGGSATLLGTLPLSSISEDVWKGVTQRPDISGYFLIAGGGGGGASHGGDEDEGSTFDAGDGGSGGSATASSSSFVIADGVTGESGDKGSGGSGGSPSETSGGTGGVGGLGGGSSSWQSGGSLVPPTSWSPGGGQASSKAGQGGGGFGGGHEGDRPSDTNGGGGGGGGGGSFAVGSSASNPYTYACVGGVCTVVSTPSSPGGSGGAVELRYVDRENRPVLYRLNVNGPPQAATDSGPPWINDNPFFTGGFSPVSTTHSIDLKHHSLAGTAPPQAVMQTSKFGINDTLWALPMPVGEEVEVRLLIAQIDDLFPAVGDLTFSAQLEGSTPSAYKKIDPVGQAGALYRAIAVSAVVKVNDGALDISADGGVVEGIEVRRVGSKNTVWGGYLTTTAHPEATDCLDTADAGVILSNLNHQLIWQADGDLVLYDSSFRPIWHSETENRGARLCFESDGDLVVLAADGSTVFDAGSSGGSRLILDNSCNLSITQLGGPTVFQTRTNCSSSPLPTPTSTRTSTPGPTTTFAPTFTGTPTQTSTPTGTPSFTRTPTHTWTPTHTFTATRTETSTHTATQAATPTETSTETPVATDTATVTPTQIATDTATSTPTEDATETPTATATATPQVAEVQKMQLTSSGQSVPSECLQLPGDAGVVLDNGVAQLVWRSDGNLVVVQGETLLWESATSDAQHGGNGGRQLCFPDYLYVESGTGGLLFESTFNLNGETLRLDTDCNLSIVTASGVAVWETGSSCGGGQ